MSLKQEEQIGVTAQYDSIPGQQPNTKSSHERTKLGSPEHLERLKTPSSEEGKYRNWPSPLTTSSSVWANSSNSAIQHAAGWRKSPKNSNTALGPLSSDFGMSPLSKMQQSSENWRVVGSPTTKASSLLQNEDPLDLNINTAKSRQRASSVIDPQVEEPKEPIKWGALGLKWTGMTATEWSDQQEEFVPLNESENKDELVLPKFGRTRSKSQSIDGYKSSNEGLTSEIDSMDWPKVGEFNPLLAVVSSVNKEDPKFCRRHSMVDNGEANLDAELDSLKLENQQICSDDARIRSFSDSSAKSSSSSFQLSSYKGVLYLIEFKAGRIEVYYVPETSGKPQMSVKIGDLVIVEADRGEDLGKIMGVISVEKLKQLITPEDLIQDDKDDENNPYGGLGVREIVPKRIHRLAQPADLRLGQAKAQEEAIAMVRCQSRVRQKKLPMEVVDAEYQWDRNKLTFYFIADRRIDFRELVRDLFRIYKTRIWMCAVDKNRSLYAKLRS